MHHSFLSTCLLIGIWVASIVWLFLFTFLNLKAILSDINEATSALFLDTSCLNYFFLSLYFQSMRVFKAKVSFLVGPISFNCVFYPFIHCLLIGQFNQFLFKVIIDKQGLLSFC